MCTEMDQDRILTLSYSCRVLGLWIQHFELQIPMFEQLTFLVDIPIFGCALLGGYFFILFPGTRCHILSLFATTQIDQSLFIQDGQPRLVDSFLLKVNKRGLTLPKS